MMTDYEKAKAQGRTQLDRWDEGIKHHPMSVRLMRFLAEHDFNDYDDHFGWKVGGDGDNGEALMYEMDAFFETVMPMEKTIPTEVLDLVRFLAATCNEIDKWAYQNCNSEALFKYPLIQGTVDQIRLRRIAEQPRNAANIREAADWMQQFNREETS